MRKFQDAIQQAGENVDALEQERLRCFEKLADAQRGAPEIAMVSAQQAMGGGVLSYCIEHVGDLTHRMCEHPDFIPFCGYESVRPKVERSYRMLSSRYINPTTGEQGFYAEFMQNMRNNAFYYNPEAETHEEALEKHMAKVTAALHRYADEHRKLKVYNQAQQIARDAAIALGEMDFKGAQRLLGILDGWSSTPQRWAAKASEFDPNYDVVTEAAASKAPVDAVFAALGCTMTGSWQGAVGNYVLGAAEAHLIRRSDALIEIGSIYVPDDQRQSGFASKALKKIIDAADAFGVTLELDVHDSSEFSDRHSLTNLELEEWYGRFGFRYDQSHDTYFRKPNVVLGESITTKVIAYHGAQQPIEQWEDGETYFAADPQEARSYCRAGGCLIYKCEITVSHPYQTQDYDEFAEAEMSGLISSLKAQGYDSIVYGSGGSEGEQFITFSPSQVKVLEVIRDGAALQ
jgi:GNAT superfamily N-acetyltransferase